MTDKKTYIVVPAYNESEVIGLVLDELHKQNYRNIIVVDDGSTDTTYLKAKGKDAVVLRHMLNRGKGAAIKTGIEAAKLLHSDQVITFDADGQHEPQDIKEALTLLEKYDVVLGKRNFNEKHIPFFKKVGNFFGNVITWFIHGLWVSDSQSGMRAYSKKAISLIETLADRYDYDSEIMREIVRNKLTYTEMPIHVHYTEYSQKKINRQSYTGAIKTVIKMILAS
ncbi:glycosyltransferase family 2 protein [Candidatus Roizmanbacteria bacterium]|nr:glycosyltransferase family 2 protein [Candidatus Roizmanbacteria bacterium]